MKAATWKDLRIDQGFGTEWVAATVHSFQPAEMSERGQEDMGTVALRGGVVLVCAIAD